MPRVRIAFVDHSPSKYRYSPELPPMEERRLATLEQHKLSEWHSTLVSGYPDIYTYWYNVLDRPSTVLNPNPWELDLILYAIDGMNAVLALGPEVFMFLKSYVPADKLIRLPNPKLQSTYDKPQDVERQIAAAKRQLVLALSQANR